MTGMNAIQPPGALPPLIMAAEPPFAIARPGPAAASSPLVFASPHSGSIYPAEMMAASVLDAAAIRRSEDALVDRLVEDAPAGGATLITARLARAWIDVNREPWELDQGMFEDELPDFARGRTARVAAGLGSIAKVVSEGREIYARKLTFAEAQLRVETVHRPYHDALARLLAEARGLHGLAILIDWHSMPAAAASGVVTTRHGRGCDIVLGDRFGAACAPALTTLVERELEAMGYRCARNSPYAGGYTTEHYGRPARKTHALQIEINRALYLDEATLEPTEGMARLKADIERVTGVLAAEWKRLK
jgi:N-formylglutamate amidohydrolase